MQFGFNYQIIETNIKLIIFRVLCSQQMKSSNENDFKLKSIYYMLLFFKLIAIKNLNRILEDILY